MQSYSPSKFRELVTHWLVVDLIPFSMVDSPPLRAIFKLLHHDVALFGCETVRKDIQKCFAEEHKKWTEFFPVSSKKHSTTLFLLTIYQALQSRVSISLDAWTSPNQIPFLGITAKWINDEWELNTILIGFERLVGEHTGSNLAEATESVLREYGILNKVLQVMFLFFPVEH